MKNPIIYTIENIDGKHYVSDYLVINKKTDVIRFRLLGENVDFEEDVKKISINGNDVDFKSCCAANTAFKTRIICIRSDEFLNSTNDLKVELIKNSIIEVFLCF